MAASFRSSKVVQLPGLGLERRHADPKGQLDHPLQPSSIYPENMPHKRHGPVEVGHFSAWEPAFEGSAQEVLSTEDAMLAQSWRQA